jgi:very-short-patch-repair endonuclease
MLTYNSRLSGLSRALRKNMTDAERHLWLRLRMRQLGGYQFYRQRIIGDYVVDFFCPRARLVIEVDGVQHSSDDTTAADEERDEYLKSKGLKVIRFNDIEVLKNIDGVVEQILANMGNVR